MITAMFVLTILLPGPARQESVVDARSVLTLAVAAATGVKSDNSRDEALTAIARIAVQAGLYEDAMRAAQQMKQSDHRAAVAGAAAQKHIANADWQAAGEALTWFLEESRSRHWYAARMQIDYSRASSSRPDRIGVNRALALAARGESVEARDIAIRISDRMSRFEALHGIAVAQLEFGDIDGARSTLDQIPTRLPQINRVRAFPNNGSEFRADGLRRIAVALADRGEFEKAFEIADSIENVRFRESAAWKVAERQLVHESAGVDSELLSRFGSVIDKLSLYGLAALPRMKRGDEPGAQEVLCEAMSVAQPLAEPTARVPELIAAGAKTAASVGARAALGQVQQNRSPFERSCLLVGIARYLLDR